MNPTPLSPESDRLIQELRRCEVQLQDWLAGSAVNALWFLVDPVDALRAANLGLTEESLLELQKAIDSLETKLSPLSHTGRVAQTLGAGKASVS